MRKILHFLVIGIVAALVYRHASTDPPRRDFAGIDAPAAAPDSADLQVERAANEPQKYRCDGRTHCSQMTSCEEARYFLQNCPGVQMDGEGDGIPCERQWCRHMLSR